MEQSLKEPPTKITLKQQIEALSLHNPVAHAVRTMARVRELDWQATLEHMVIHLANETQQSNYHLSQYVQRYGVLPE